MPSQTKVKDWVFVIFVFLMGMEELRDETYSNVKAVLNEKQTHYLRITTGGYLKRGFMGF